MMKKERKKPSVQTKTFHKFVGNKYGDKEISKEERDAIIYPLGEFEHKGKGLPEKVRKDGECQFYTLSFDIRMAHGDKEGTLELAYALKNSQKHTIMPYDGLTEENSHYAKGDFERNIHRMIKDTCFFFADACVKNQTEDFDGKREFLEKAIEHITLEYKKILGLGHYKIIEQSENEDGMRTEKSNFIDYGVRPQTKEELEAEKREFLNEIYSALKKLKQNHINKPKQKDLMPNLFDRYKDKEKKISEMLKKHNLVFKQLWHIFNATNREEFINNLMLITRVTDKQII